MTTVVDIGTLIERRPEIRGGRPIIAGTATSVRRIAVLYKEGLNAEAIVERMGDITLAQVYAALTYYHANREEIEEDLAAEAAEYWRLAALHGRKKHIKVDLKREN